MLPKTDAEFLKFIDSQIDAEGLIAAVEQARLLYEQAKRRRFDCQEQLKAHDASKPLHYVYEWLVVRYEIVSTTVNAIEHVDQCRSDYHKAQAILLNERRRVIAENFPRVAHLAESDHVDTSADEGQTKKGWTQP